jgi:hypothetical protein
MGATCLTLPSPPDLTTFARWTSSAWKSPRAKLSRRGLRWALEGLVVQHLTIARIAEALAVSWNTANDAVLAEASACSSMTPAGSRACG